MMEQDRRWIKEELKLGCTTKNATIKVGRYLVIDMKIDRKQAANFKVLPSGHLEATTLYRPSIHIGKLCTGMLHRARPSIGKPELVHIYHNPPSVACGVKAY